MPTAVDSECETYVVNGSPRLKFLHRTARNVHSTEVHEPSVETLHAAVPPRAAQFHSYRSATIGLTFVACRNEGGQEGYGRKYQNHGEESKRISSTGPVQQACHQLRQAESRDDSN